MKILKWAIATVIFSLQNILNIGQNEIFDNDYEKVTTKIINRTKNLIEKNKEENVKLFTPREINNSIRCERIGFFLETLEKEGIIEKGKKGKAVAYQLLNF